MNLTKTLQIACGLALVAARPVLAAPLPATGVFTYTSQCLGDDGLIVGYRVAMLRTKTATKVQIDFTDAGGETHDLARDVRFDAAKGALSFSYRGKTAHSFTGTATTDALSGSFDKARPTSLRVLPVLKDSDWSLETLTPCKK